MPYLATSITEFWRRWHMTLSRWLRDYLYIPLGGNRRGPIRTYVNLIATMLLGGLWHGANWTFVVWGLFHGVGLATHKLWQERRQRTAGPDPWPTRALSWAATYAFVCVGWVFFRSPDFSAALTVLRKSAGLAPGGVAWFYLPLAMMVPVVALAHAVGLTAAQGINRGRQSRRWTPRRPAREAIGRFFRATCTPPAGTYILIRRGGFVGSAVLFAALLLLFLFAPLHQSPFIYFRF